MILVSIPVLEALLETIAKLFCWEKGMSKWIFVILVCQFLWILTVSEVHAVEQENSLKAEKNFQTIYDSVPLEDVEAVLQELQDEQVDFSFQQYVQDVIQGNRSCHFKELCWR